MAVDAGLGTIAPDEDVTILELLVRVPIESALRHVLTADAALLIVHGISPGAGVDAMDFLQGAGDQAHALPLKRALRVRKALTSVPPTVAVEASALVAEVPVPTRVAPAIVVAAKVFVVTVFRFIPHPFVPRDTVVRGTVIRSSVPPVSTATTALSGLRRW
ncbi:hypothetical protein [Brevibacterium antiquum]|uniref:hypothetical protein n=1 Tax=Brevibacterium antiquum TaxID=234835 RepID=UPI0018DFE1D2|nr:hypothetical protein [Brevibacterium antiquum]